MIIYNLGNALQDQGKLEEAIEAYKKASSLKPNYADTYSNMGVALKDKKESRRGNIVPSNLIMLQPITTWVLFLMIKAKKGKL